MYVCLFCTACLCIDVITAVLQSRSHMPRQAGHSRFKPFDVLHEQRQRRRIMCHKKVKSQSSCIPAVGQHHCLSSHMQPSDHLSRSLSSPLNVAAVNGCEPVCSYIVGIPSNSFSSEVMMDTIPICHLAVGYNTCINVGADKLDKKNNIMQTSDKHLKSRKESTADTLKEETADGGHVTYNRFVLLIMSLLIMLCYLFFSLSVLQYINGKNLPVNIQV